MFEKLPTVSLVALIATACGCARDDNEVVVAEQYLATTHEDSLGRSLEPELWEELARNDATGVTLLARVKVEGGVVEFYDLLPGRLLVSRVGKGPTSEEESGRRSARETWDALTHAAPPPPALERALSYEDERNRLALARERPAVEQSKSRSFYTASDDTLGVDGHSVAQAAGGFCSTTYHTDVLGRCDPTPWDYRVCKNNRTNNASASHDDVGELRANVCPYRGNVLATISADESGTPQGSWTISEDYFRSWSYWDPRCDGPWFWNDCPTISLSITEASGDGYNWRFLVDDVDDY